MGIYEVRDGVGILWWRDYDGILHSGPVAQVQEKEDEESVSEQLKAIMLKLTYIENMLEAGVCGYNASY